MKRNRSNIWWLPLLCLIAALLIGMVACGGSGDTATDPATGDTTADATGDTSAATATDTSETDTAPAESDTEATATDAETSSDTETEPSPQPETVTVRFTGESVSTADQTVLYGTSALRPRDPEREGYAFLGWVVEGQEDFFDFSTPLTADLTLSAVWEDVRQDGSAERPYRISSAEDLMDFSERMNDPEAEGYEDYCRAHFVLTADIDMAGCSYVAAGQTVTLREGEEDEVTLGGFMGEFDGAGYTIRNLTIRKNLRSTIYYVGLFGVTEQAYIHDLTLEDIDYTIESGANTTAIGAVVGGIAGRSDLSEFFNVKVSGVIEMRMCADNSAYIGGLCGIYGVSGRSGQAYVAYVENCSAGVETVIGKFDDGEKGVLEGAINGGLIGYLTTSSGAVGLLNCTAEGKVYGGQYVGGLVGYINGSYVSVINCANYAPVTGTASDSTYCGGIVGFSSGDNTIMDCVSLGRVKGVKAPTGSVYKSYAGGILGYASEDDYEMYYDAGTAVINCYYLNEISTFDVRNSAGKKLSRATDFTADFAQQNLRWDLSILPFGEDGHAHPADHRSEAKTWKLTLVEVDGSSHTVERNYANGLYAMVGEHEAGKSQGTILFFDWMHGEDVRLRFYVPVIKDMTLTAKCGDVADIAGVYTGTWTLHESGDAGTLVLMTNGSVQWVSDTVVRGTYTWDGKHIELEFFSNVGEVSGTVDGKKLTYTVDAGMTGSVEYTFSKTDLRFVGEYFSADGDSLTFSGESGVAFRAEGVNSGRPISGSFTDKGDRLEISGFGDYFASFAVTVNSDGSLTVTAVPRAGKGKALDGVTFAPPASVSYEGQPFVGDYHCPYLNLSSYDNTPYLENYTLSLNADGTVAYRGFYSTKLGYYYVFRDGSYIVLTLEGYTSIFRYDAEHNVIWGTLERGVTAKTTLVLLPVSEGDAKLFVLDLSRENILMTNPVRSYLIRDGKIAFDAVIEAPSFEEGARVTVDGKDYRAVYYVFNDRSGYSLLSIGDEEGSYTWDGKRITLDGLGGFDGDVRGSYWRYDDLIVLLSEDDRMVGFSRSAARAAEGVVTPLATDGYQGVWYKASELHESEVGDKYYKLLLDGFGHATFLYWNEDYGCYRFTWGNEWTPYTLTDTGVHCQFNQYQLADLVFYYDMQLVYSKSFGYMGETSFTAGGYTGTTQPPALPNGLIGSYTGLDANGVAVVFNLRADLSGSWRGQPFTATYDGEHSLHFVTTGESYCFDTQALTLTGGGQTVSLSRAGEVTEVIPAALCGSFSGVWSGLNVASGEVRTVVVRADGTVLYQGMEFAATYSAGAVYGTSGNFTIRLTWDGGSGYTARVVFTDPSEGGSHEYVCESLQPN